MRTHSNKIVMGIKPQFAEKILDGTKIHTCRASIQRASWEMQIGDKIRFFTGLRTKNCQFIVEKEIVRIEPIFIQVSDIFVHIEIMGKNLSRDPLTAFIKKDGFTSMQSIHKFFDEKKNADHIWEGYCIFWENTNAY
jgi:hypothetical protein